MQFKAILLTLVLNLVIAESLPFQRPHDGSHDTKMAKRSVPLERRQHEGHMHHGKRPQMLSRRHDGPHDTKMSRRSIPLERRQHEGHDHHGKRHQMLSRRHDGPHDTKMARRSVPLGRRQHEGHMHHGKRPQMLSRRHDGPHDTKLSRRLVGALGSNAGLANAHQQIGTKDGDELMQKFTGGNNGVFNDFSKFA